jgi:SnoaL-like domain
MGCSKLVLMDLATIEEIRQVKYRYLRCVDLKLWDELAEVFTPDATVDYGTQVYGKPLKLAGRCAELLEQIMSEAGRCLDRLDETRKG